MVLSQGAVIPAGDKKSDRGALLKDHGSLGQSTPVTAQ